MVAKGNKCPFYLRYFIGTAILVDLHRAAMLKFLFRANLFFAPFSSPTNELTIVSVDLLRLMVHQGKQHLALEYTPKFPCFQRIPLDLFHQNIFPFFIYLKSVGSFIFHFGIRKEINLKVVRIKAVSNVV